MSSGIHSVQHEDRIFPPPADFAARMGTLHVPDIAQAGGKGTSKVGDAIAAAKASAIKIG